MAAVRVEQQELQAALLQRLLETRGGRRHFVPVRRAFLQDRSAGGPGPLAVFVTHRRKRALDLYLLIHALASSPPFDVALRSRTWAAALGMDDTPSSQVFVSRTLTWLEGRRLIVSERDGIVRRVFLLDESGDGQTYRHPASTRRPDYFKLPYAYWLDGCSERLSLPAKTVLLIGLSLRESFLLPLEHGASWYGVSADSLGRGLRELRDAQLLTSRSWVKSAPESPTGATEQRRYTLRGAFAKTETRAQSGPDDR